MKGYESITHCHLMRRCPVIIRVDGRAFHTLTRNMEKPFDSGLVYAMTAAAREVAEDIQGCKLAYVQSDKASFLLLDTDTLETQPWFGYDLSKLVSLAASTMTAHFNNFQMPTKPSTPRLSVFDARAFNVPFEEIANYFLWRAKDWQRNSIQMLAQSHFSPRELHGKKRSDMVDMLTGIGVDWQSLPGRLRCGSYFVPGRRAWEENVTPDFASVSALVDECLGL